MLYRNVVFRLVKQCGALPASSAKACFISLIHLLPVLFYQSPELDKCQVSVLQRETSDVILLSGPKPLPFHTQLGSGPEMGGSGWKHTGYK